MGLDNPGTTSRPKGHQASRCANMCGLVHSADSSVAYCVHTHDVNILARQHCVARLQNPSCTPQFEDLHTHSSTQNAFIETLLTGCLSVITFQPVLSLTTHSADSSVAYCGLHKSKSAYPTSQKLSRTDRQAVRPYTSVDRPSETQQRPLSHVWVCTTLELLPGPKDVKPPDA